MIRRVRIESYRNGEYVGTRCKHCVNVARVVLIKGREAMAMCLTCSPEPKPTTD